MAITTFEQNTLTEQFIQKVIDEIMTNQLRIGEKLPSEREYCEEMHVSRAVIYNGFHQLQEMGFIEIIPRKGAYVRDYAEDGKINVINAIIKYNGKRFTPEYFEPLMDTRQALEPVMMSYAAKNHMPEQCQKASEILEEMNQNNDALERAILSSRFLKTLVQASGNSIFVLLFNTFYTVYENLGEAVFRYGFNEIETEDLRELLDAVQSGDCDRAAKIDLQHIESAREWIEAHYEPGNSFRGQNF